MSILRSLPELEAFLQSQSLSLAECGLEYLRLSTNPFPLRIPEHYARLIDWRDLSDPLKLIVIPQPEEQQVTEYELADPIGDAAHEAVPGLIHRYPDRVLLLLTTYCHIHCRFCFRREVVGRVRPIDFVKIREYLSEHPEVSEVIFSGGDPFTYPVGFLRSLQEQLSGLEHVKIWRFHTRIPATDPEAINNKWLDVMERFPGQKVVVLHVDHPREVSAETVSLIQKLQVRGCVLLSQTVLLKGVNNSRETLIELFRTLMQHGVKPYYLHHLDQARGTSHYRLSIEKGLALFQSLRGHLSGICLPEYVLDLPGGYGKIPVSWLERGANRENDTDNHRNYFAHTFEGKTVKYVDHANNLRRVEPFTALVLPGLKLGRTIGFPTLNLDPDTVPKDTKLGVHAALVKHNGQTYQGALYYGPRLVLKETKTILEIFLLDFDQEIYGEQVEFTLQKHIRGIMDFGSFKEMKSQLEKDVEAVKTALTPVQA